MRFWFKLLIKTSPDVKWKESQYPDRYNEKLKSMDFRIKPAVYKQYSSPFNKGRCNKNPLLGLASVFFATLHLRKQHP